MPVGIEHTVVIVEEMTEEGTEMNVETIVIGIEIETEMIAEIKSLLHPQLKIRQLLSSYEESVLHL